MVILKALTRPREETQRKGHHLQASTSEGLLNVWERRPRGNPRIAGYARKAEATAVRSVLKTRHVSGYIPTSSHPSG